MSQDANLTVDYRLRMARIQKEMKILSRNNVEKQKLSSKIDDLNHKQVKKHEQCSHSIRLMNGEMRKVRQTSGRSGYGVICTDKEASQLVHDSDLMKAKWQLTAQPLDETKILMNPLSTASTTLRRIRKEDETRRKSMPGHMQPSRRSSSYRKRPSTHSSVSFQTLPTDVSDSKRKISLGSRHHTVLGVENEGKLLNSEQQQQQPNQQIRRSLSISNMDTLIPSDQERKAVRRTTIIANPDETQPKTHTQNSYIKPHHRYKYDLLTSKRLMFLRRSLPADFVSGSEHQLSSAFSVNSRRSALCVLVDLNNQKIKKSLEAKPDAELQNKLVEFLKNNFQ